MGAGDCSRPIFFRSKNRGKSYVGAAHLRSPESKQERKVGRAFLFALHGRNGHRPVFVADLLHNRLGCFGDGHVPVSELTRNRGLIQHFD